jgi:hypothetical protein
MCFCLVTGLLWTIFLDEHIDVFLSGNRFALDYLLG